MKKHVEVTMLFDDVKFGIDVRDMRIVKKLTQAELGRMVGFRSGGAISLIECANQTDSISVRRYMTLCNVLGLSPMHYWYTEEDTLAKAEGLDWTAGDV